MNQRMKIAICFFGITRNLKEYTLDSIERHLMAVAAEKDPAYKKFAHFNLVECIFNPRSGEKNVPVNVFEYKFLNCDKVACTDQAQVDRELDCESLEKFGNAWQDNFQSLKNSLRQLYSLNQVTSLLVQSGEHFDLVIYSRADIRLGKEIIFPKVHPNTLYTPWFDKYRGLNDRFALGDFETMVKYGRRFFMAQRYCEQTGQPFHAERFLLWYSQQQRIKNRDLTSIEFCRVRANGRVKPVNSSGGAKLKYRLKKLFHPLRTLTWKNP
jgi:hypothetical protein